jgi:hypothetical protein
VVRGPAALLGVVGVNLAYVLVAPSLPELHPPELSAAVSCTVGLVLVLAIVVGLVAMADARWALIPAVAGAGLIVAALDANSVAAAATPFEAALVACLGIAFAVVFDAPALALALPLFVAAIDIAQAYAGGSPGVFTLSTTKPGDALVLELPDWGTGLAAARLSVAHVVFFAAFAAYARRLALRERAAEVGMLCSLLVAIGCQVFLDVELPVLALIAVGYLLPNVDRFRPLFAQARGG